MSYTVLARKWRPRQFDQMIGQEHVLRALINALEGDRLHHAYLFTGTRGVGKTTVARILAKSLNCESGVSAHPCGSCGSCIDVDQGRFLDLIEVDAASRTKVDDTRELLDNVQYAPSRGRYKIYLIDEVHMLSTHSFNALLKTLEEPPPHVKFLLATTDPKKLPVTVLSRCLQFHLKRLPADAITGHLAKLCAEERIETEERALGLLACAAQGSVRDALSLLDQAIAHGGGRIATAEVSAMLGTVDRDSLHGVLAALADADGARVLAEVARMDEHVPDYDSALVELSALLQRLAVLQAVPEAAQGSDDAMALQALAARISPQDVQLYYQIALLGRRELELAADARGAFEMTLLRMLTLRPASYDSAASPSAARAPANAGTAPATPAAGAATARERPSTARAGARPEDGPAPPAPVRTVSAAAPDAPDEWSALISRAAPSGAALQLARHCVLRERRGSRFHLLLDAQGTGMNTATIRVRLEQTLAEHLGEAVQLQIEAADQAALRTPARALAEQRDERQRRALEAIQEDPNVRALQETFDATLHTDTVQPEEGD